MFEFLHKNARWIGGGFLLTYCSSFGQTFFISASIGEWRALFDLSHGEIGRLYMFATLASALTLPWLGRIVDYWPAARTIALAAPVLAAAMLLAAFAPAVGYLFVAIFLLRLFGQGMMTHIALTATGRWYEAQRGRAVSIVVLGHQGGEATLPLLIAAVTAWLGFTAGWVMGAAVLLLLLAPIAYWAYRLPRQPGSAEMAALAARPDRRQWTRSEVVRDPLFYLLLTATLAPAFIGTVVFYHQDYLTDVHDWPPTLYARSLSVLALCTVICALICGGLVDRFGAIRILPLFLLPLGATCFVLSAASVDAPSLFLAMCLLGVSYGFSSTLFGALWPEVYGAKHLGSIRALTVSAMVLSTAAGPGLTGTLIDAGYPLSRQMLFLGAYCLLVCGLMSVVSLKLSRRLRQVAARSVSG